MSAANVLFHQEHGLAQRVDLADYVEHLFHQDRSESEGGLVQHHQLRFAHQGAPEGQHLLLPSRQGPPLLPGPLLQSREEGVNPVPVALDAVLVVPREGPQLEVLLHRQVGQDSTPLRAHGHPKLHNLLWRPAGEVGLRGPRRAVENFPLDALYQPGHGPYGTALSRAVRANEGDYASLRYLDINSLDGVNRAVVYVEPLNFQHISHTPPQGRRQ